MSKLLARAKVKREIAETCYQTMGQEDAYRDECCYNLQQAIEMALKSMVELYGGRYAENHDVRANINILNRMNITVPMQKELREIASTLYSWETESRYKDAFISLKEDIDQARLIADALILHCDSLLQETNAQKMRELPSGKIPKT